MCADDDISMNNKPAFAMATGIGDHANIMHGCCAENFAVGTALQGMYAETNHVATSSPERFDEKSVQGRCARAGIHLALQPVDTESRQGHPFAPAQHGEFTCLSGSSHSGHVPGCGINIRQKWRDFCPPAAG